MFIAVDRFKIAKGQEAASKKVWATRDSHLDGVLAFMDFKLVRGPKRKDHTLYASHSVWDSEEAFGEWTRSEAFRLAHRDAGDNRALYLGHPEFEGFTVVLSGD